MSVVWLVVVGLAAWTLVSVAFGLFVGRLIAAQNRRAIDSTAFTRALIVASGNFEGAKGRLTPFDREGPSAA